LSCPLKKYYSELTVSVDGFSAFHEKMRGKVGLFEDVKNSIKLLALIGAEKSFREVPGTFKERQIFSPYGIYSQVSEGFPLNWHQTS
jgi:hypothetical protein